MSENIFSQNRSKTQPTDQKCPHCGTMIKAQYSSEYGWEFVCEPCEINWEA
jgi:predicted RNA-binding Zn-ribbon protein involved in translation (DUF1610 family)